MEYAPVDRLMQAAGGINGSFYKAFDSEERLFFTALENIHARLCEAVDLRFAKVPHCPSAECTATTVPAVCKHMSDTGVMTFIGNDMVSLL